MDKNEKYQVIHTELAEKYNCKPHIIVHIRSTYGMFGWSREKMIEVISKRIASATKAKKEYEIGLKRKLIEYSKRPTQKLREKLERIKESINSTSNNDIRREEVASFLLRTSDEQFLDIITYGKQETD